MKNSLSVAVNPSLQSQITTLKSPNPRYNSTKTEPCSNRTHCNMPNRRSERTERHSVKSKERLIFTKNQKLFKQQKDKLLLNICQLSKMPELQRMYGEKIVKVICIDAKWYRVRFEFAYRSLSDIMCNTIKRFLGLLAGILREIRIFATVVRAEHR